MTTVRARPVFYDDATKYCRPAVTGQAISRLRSKNPRCRSQSIANSLDSSKGQISPRSITVCRDKRHTIYIIDVLEVAGG